MMHRLAAAGLCAIVCAACSSSADRRGNADAAGSVADLLAIDTLLLLGYDDPATDASLFTKVSVDGSHYYLYAAGLLQGDSVVGVIRVNGLDRSRDTLELSVADRHQEYGLYVADVDVSGDTIAILLFDGLFVFIVDDGSVNHRSAPVAPVFFAPLDRSYNQVVLLAGKALLLKCSLGGKTMPDPREITHALTVALTDRVLPEPRYFPNPLGVEFVSFAPRRLTATVGGRVFVADLSRYRIVVYEMDGRPVDSMVRRPAQWIDVYGLGYRGVDQADLVVTNREQGERHSQRMEKLRDFAYTMSSIRLIQPLNDSTLMVSWATGGKQAQGLMKGRTEVLHDLWRRTPSGWKPLRLDIPDFSPEPSQRFAQTRMLPLTYTYEATGSDRVPIYQIQPMKPPTNWDISYGDWKDAALDDMNDTTIAYSVVFYRMRLLSSTHVSPAWR